MPTKVLVFESDPGFAEELRSGLAAYGCEITVVDDATSGLQVASAHKPDLILLAIELPKMNGFSVCNKLKRDASLKSVPLIIMSSDSTEETFEQHRRLRTRAEDYLHKPISVSELVQKIHPYVPLSADAPEATAPDADRLLDEEIVIEDSPDLEVSEGTIDEELLDSEFMEDAQPIYAEAEFEAEERPSLVDSDVEDFADEAFDAILETPAEAAQYLTPPVDVASDLELEDLADDNLGAHESNPAELAEPMLALSEPPLAAQEPEEAFDAADELSAEEDFEDAVLDSLPPPSRLPEIEVVNPPAAAPITSSPPRASSLPPRPTTSSIPITFDQERSRFEVRVQELESELGKARAKAQSLEDSLQRELARDSEVQKLRRELDEAKAKPAASAGGGSAREFLELREQLNRKDKEILDVRDELSHKEKELLNVRDSQLALEREKADNSDRMAELERRAAELERNAEAFKSDKEQANKRADDYKRKAEKLRTDYDAKASEFTELRSTIDSELQKKDEEHGLSLEQLDAQYSGQLASLGEKRQAALAEAQQSFEQSLAEALARAKEAAEAELLEATRQHTEEAARELANTESGLRAAHESALLEQKATQEQLTLQQQAAHVEETQRLLEEARGAAEATLTAQRLAWERESQARTDALNQEQQQAMDRLNEERAELLGLRDGLARDLERFTLERQEEQQAATQRVNELNQKLTELEARSTKEQADSQTFQTELASVQELLNDTNIRLTREIETARAQALSDVAEAQQKAREEIERLSAELGAELSQAQNRAAEVSRERDQLRVELANTRESLGTELGETKSALKEEQNRNQRARTKWEQDRGSHERAKDALAAALAQIEETESRSLD